MQKSKMNEGMKMEKMTTYEIMERLRKREGINFNFVSRKQMLEIAKLSMIKGLTTKDVYEMKEILDDIFNIYDRRKRYFFVRSLIVNALLEENKTKPGALKGTVYINEIKKYVPRVFERDFEEVFLSMNGHVEKGYRFDLYDVLDSVLIPRLGNYRIGIVRL